MIQPHHYIVLAFIAALVWAFLVLVRKSPDDAESGTLIGQVSPAEDAFRHAAPRTWPAKHFVSACMYCHRVTRADTHAHSVRVGDELRVSHGICPVCIAKAKAQLDGLPAGAPLSEPALSHRRAGPEAGAPQAQPACP